MAFSNENGYNNMVMPVSPMTNGNSGFCNGFGGDGAWWLLVLFLFMFNGNGWNGGFGNNSALPYMMNNNTNNDVQRGFDQQSIMTSLNGINSNLNSGFSNAEVSRCNAQANLLQAMNNNQNAINNSMNSIASGLQNCCCENRAGLADLKYTVATEACADRSAVTTALREVIASNTANTQVILDKLCQQELDALRSKNNDLQTQVNLANLRASQEAQTSKILQDNSAQTQALERYLNPTPIPAYMVPNPSGGCQFSNCSCA